MGKLSFTGIKSLKLNQLLIPLLLILVLVAGGIAYYYYSQYQRSQLLLKNPTVVGQKEAQQLIDAVGKLIILPKDETPTVATVTDASKLKDQPFFKNAKNGFKVLIYPKARKAILYDPVEKKIVDVAPVNISQPSTAPQSASSEEISPTPIQSGPTLIPSPTSIPATPIKSDPTQRPLLPTSSPTVQQVSPTP